MKDAPVALSGKARMVLRCIAAGMSYEQILTKHPVLTYPDIFEAAKEVLLLHDAMGGARTEHSAAGVQPGIPPERRKRHARAGEKWTDEEDAVLRQMLGDKKEVGEIMHQLQRSELAVKARMVKLGLISPEQVPELERLNARRKRQGQADKQQ